MSLQNPREIRIPTSMLPSDGRFGCGPSKVRPAAVEALAAAGTWLGTSHRQAPVRQVVSKIRSGLRELFGLPDGWEVVLGNGGSTTFWDVATFGLIERQSEHLVFGEFSSKFAEASAAAPHLDAPTITSSVPGTHPAIPAASNADVVALTHNETSTGVSMVLRRPAGDALVVVDATSGSGGINWNPADVDVYYFAPQKCFSSDGGLFVALCSPRAIERIERTAASGRWTPASLSLKIALDNSRLDQTHNTPALATLFLLDNQIAWMLANGGMAFTTARCAGSSRTLYTWAETRPGVSPFVADHAQRSPVVVTLDLEGVAADDVLAALRANGIVDTDGYRKLGRNQLRVGVFPSVEPTDVEALTHCFDHVLDQLAT